MRKIFNKAVAVTATLSLAAALFANFATPAKAETGDSVTLEKWSFYQGGTSFRNEKDAWAQRFFNSVTVGSQTITGWGSPDEGTPETTKTASVVADNFTADIRTTGWDGAYTSEGVLQGNNPYLLRADMTGIKITTGHDYNFSFDAKWTRTNEQAPEKNIQVSIANSDESVFANDSSAVTKITVANGSTASYSQNFTVWSGDGTLSIQLAFGCFLDDFKKQLTTEDTSAAGTLEITNVKLVDLGLNPDYKEIPTAWIDDETTVKPDTPTKKVTPATTKKITTKKFGKVKKLSVKNKKKGKLTVSWKKVKGAKKYEIKVGKKTWHTSKTKKVLKLKVKVGKKVTVKVRAEKAKGYKAGAWSKKTIKIKK